MFYKILEKYSNIKALNDFKHGNFKFIWILLVGDETRKIVAMEEEIVNNFLDLHDKVFKINQTKFSKLQDVKIVHYNQNMIEKDLQILYKENEKLVNHTKAAIKLYDDFLEILKVL